MNRVVAALSLSFCLISSAVFAGEKHSLREKIWEKDGHIFYHTESGDDLPMQVDGSGNLVADYSDWTPAQKRNNAQLPLAQLTSDYKAYRASFQPLQGQMYRKEGKPYFLDNGIFVPVAMGANGVAKPANGWSVSAGANVGDAFLDWQASLHGTPAWNSLQSNIARMPDEKVRNAYKAALDARVAGKTPSGAAIKSAPSDSPSAETAQGLEPVEKHAVKGAKGLAPSRSASRAVDEKNKLSAYEATLRDFKASRQNTPTDEIRSVMGDKRHRGVKMACHTDPKKNEEVNGYEPKNVLKPGTEPSFDSYLHLALDGTAGSGLPFSGLRADMFTNAQKSEKADPSVSSPIVRNAVQSWSDDNRINPENKLTLRDGGLSFGRIYSNTGSYGIALKEDKLIVCGAIQASILGGPVVGDNPIEACCREVGELESLPDDSAASAKLAESEKAFKKGAKLSDEDLNYLAGKKVSSLPMRCRQKEDPQRIIQKDFAFKNDDGKIKIASSESNFGQDPNAGHTRKYADGEEFVTLAPKAAYRELKSKGNTWVAEGTRQIELEKNVSPRSFREKLELTSLDGGKYALQWTVTSQIPKQTATWMCEGAPSKWAVASK